MGECHLAHGADGVYSRLPNEKFSVCPDCTWEWVAYINKDPCKILTEQEEEAKFIMNNQAIDACPRRKQAVLGGKNQVAKHKMVKVKWLINSVVKVLKEILPSNPHHENYWQIVEEVIHELTKDKYVFL